MTIHAVDLDWYTGKLRALRKSLSYLFPCSSVKRITNPERLSNLEPEGSPQQLAVVMGRDLYLFVYPGKLNAPPCAAVRVRGEIPPSNDDLRFAKAFSKVFNRDLRWCGTNANRSDRMWQDLQSSQSVRAIAEFVCPRHVGKFQNWLRAAEAAMTLTYEGESAHPCIVFYRNETKADSNLRENYVPFPTPVSIRQLFEDKWIRGMIEGDRVALVGDLETDHLIGLTSPGTIDGHDVAGRIPLYAPHGDLRLVQGVLGASGVALMTSEKDDLFVLTAGNVVFHKAQGRWRYVNYLAIHDFLSTHCREDLVRELLRMAFDLSFERRGALLSVFLDDPSELSEMIPDLNKSSRSNRTLREALRVDCRIFDWQRRQLIAAAATVDGAVVLDSDGSVLDVACMIPPPSAARLRKHGAKESAEAGARSRAASSASLFGVAVKISEDGPVTVYVRGKKVAEVS